MCFDSGDKAQKAAEQTERERSQRITSNVGRINSAFKGREGQYADFVNALREQSNSQLGRLRNTAARQSKFALARGGLTGGSAAVDAAGLLKREGDEAALGAERGVQGQLGQLKSADEASRLQMISLAQSGNDVGNAASQTASALRANILGAQNANVVQGLGDVFGQTAANYRAQQEAAARRRGLKEAEIYAAPGRR